MTISAKLRHLTPRLASLACALSLAGCATILSEPNTVPRSLGERGSNFGYIPVDGLAVLTWADPSTCQPWFPSPQIFDVSEEAYRPLLESLPDLSVRFAVANFTANGGLTFGPSQITTRGQNYRAVLDYVNADVVPVPFFIRKLVLRSGGQVEPRPMQYQLAAGEEVVGYQAERNDLGSREERAAKEARLTADGFQGVTIPVYVGVGMRFSADILALQGGVTLSGLGVIGAEAQANRLSGTLTVQTLGINGRPVATALPLPSKLDQTTIENALLALGTSRTILFAGAQNNDVITTPRIVGIYSPVGSNPLLVNAIYSELAKVRVGWYRACRPRPATVNPPTNPPASPTAAPRQGPN